MVSFFVDGVRLLKFQGQNGKRSGIGGEVKTFERGEFAHSSTFVDVSRTDHERTVASRE
jgi:hypothetical protein